MAPVQAGMASSTVNMFRQLGSVLGPAVLGTIVTTRFPRDLGNRLAAAHLPTAVTRQVIDGATHGGSTAGLPPSLSLTVDDAAARAFTDAVHFGLLVGGIVCLAMAIPTLAFVRHRATSK